MRTLKFAALFAVLSTLAAAAPSFALLSDVSYFDFAGWDVAQVTNAAGQDFNLGGGLSVNVRVDGDLTTDPIYSGGWIRSGHLNANDTNRFRFTFTGNVNQLVVKTATVDKFEEFDIIGVGPETYFHHAGSAPNISSIGTSGIELMGTATGIGPMGAAFGETTTSAQVNLPVIIRHTSLRANKWEFFMVGRTVPEPSTYGLLGLSLLGLLGLRKRG